ncbi:MAG TPA: alpha/beta hydrolase [Kiritimatiellia bacterium]|nr:alpha/beta hydrolase [Kiritimatiellia bacterium]HPS06911.1 alpha/beta hydrolase [Kiritimatiellia bacterium]
MLGGWAGAVAALALALDAGAVQVVSNLVYKASAGAAGLGNLYLPEACTADTPVVLAIHGGGWSGGDRHSWAGVAEFFCRDLGFAVFNIEYRLTGAGPWPLCGNDCLAAAIYLFGDDFKKRSGIDGRKIWVCGGSAGGHLALWTGLSLPPERVAGIVSISGIGDLAPDARANPGRYVGLFGHAPTEAELAAASPLSRVTSKAPPILCTHAKIDTVVPVAAQERLVEACRAAGTTAVLYTYAPRDKGHSIWRPGSNPHRLFPDIEAAIVKFVNAVSK